MGTWGSGNFDSDSACEFLDVYIVDLVETIRNTISLHEADKSDDWFYESHGETRLMPATDLLLTIVTHYDFPVHSLTGLSEKEVNNWKRKYLQIYDNVIEQFTNKEEYIHDRRNVIISTFDELESFIKQYNA